MRSQNKTSRAETPINTGILEEMGGLSVIFQSLLEPRSIPGLSQPPPSHRPVLPRPDLPAIVNSLSKICIFQKIFLTLPPRKPGNGIRLVIRDYFVTC